MTLELPVELQELPNASALHSRLVRQRLLPAEGMSDSQEAHFEGLEAHSLAKASSPQTDLRDGDQSVEIS